jgi:Type I phosphodiesterase / nucleotide pyrophosphatase
MIAAGVLALCGALLLFRLTAGFGRRPADVPALTVVSSGLRVRLIAIDGFDPEVASRLSAAGRLPAFAAALDDATATVSADDTRDPARFWTTIATGQPPEIHAVHGLETRRVAGLQGALPTSSRARAIGAATDLIRLTRPGIVSGSERRVKTVWEVAAAAGLRTAVVNWWATWPAPADTGIVVTDRAPVRLERGGQLDAEVAPAETYDALGARWEALRQDASARGRQLTAPSEVEGIMRRSAELDALQLAIAREVSSPTHDLVCTYLPGLDVIQHALLNTSEGAALAPSALAGRLAALEAYYVFLDGLLSASVQPGPGELVLILTSRGRVETPTPGLFIARGSIANTRAREAVARPIDVMPTMLYALGVPISQELKSRPIVELFSPEFARRYPVRTVSRYGQPYAKPSPRSGQPLDQEMIDRLRSLGYVK